MKGYLTTTRYCPMISTRASRSRPTLCSMHSRKVMTTAEVMLFNYILFGIRIVLRFIQIVASFFYLKFYFIKYYLIEFYLFKYYLVKRYSIKRF